jgi:hypothetical protein
MTHSLKGERGKPQLKEEMGDTWCCLKYNIKVDPRVLLSVWQGRIKLFGAPRQWKKFPAPISSSVSCVGEGVLPPRLSQTPPLPGKHHPSQSNTTLPVKHHPSQSNTTPPSQTPHLPVKHHDSQSNTIPPSQTPPSQSNTTPPSQTPPLPVKHPPFPSPKTKITNILFYVLNYCINNKIWNVTFL